MNLLDHVTALREKLHTATKLAKDNLKSAQWKTKVWYDKNTLKQTFKPGDKALVICPIPSHPLRARFCGPHVVERKVSEVDYVVYMPERCKQRRLCHINMLKTYYVDCYTPSAPHTPHTPLTVAITSNIAHGERAT